jgi:hypothetical protein
VAAVDAGRGSHVDQVVGGSDRVFVVLDHEDGVADVAQAAERTEQAFVVALVEADGGFVQHVQHAGESGTDLAGQPDTLRLAAGEGGGASRQRQVVQTDIDQEAQAIDDFAQYAAGDFLALRGELRQHGAEPVAG